MVGVDVGGTFVDFALCDSSGDMAVYKVPADPADLAGSIMAGITDLADERGVTVEAFLESVELVVHGTTVATNAVLTGAGSRTGLLTTAGTRDALEMRRGIKEAPLDNRYEPPPPLVPRYLRLPVEGRVDWNGRVLTPLAPDSVDAAVKTFEAEEVEAVAVCLIACLCQRRPRARGRGAAACGPAVHLPDGLLGDPAAVGATTTASAPRC